MNRLFISLFLITLLQTAVFTQEYYPIDTSDVIWNELKESSSGDTYPPDKLIETYLIDGDTTINDLRFYKIFLKGTDGNSYIGCFREKDKKVYYTGVDYFGFETDSVILLYDFSKQENDTIFKGSVHQVVIIDIDSILINHSYRKRFQMDDGEYWIEGIGSTFGFLYPMTAIPVMYWKSELICYRHNDSLMYISPNYFDCLTEKQYSIIDTDKIWYTHIYVYNDWSVDTEVIGIGNDITVNDTTYYKLLRATGGIEIPFQDYGLIRQDSNRLFYKTLPEKPERLIYDFNISEGDTMIVYGLTDWVTNDFIECHYICDSIRYKDFHDIMRAVYYLSTIQDPTSNCESWIRGIGSYSGILHNFDGRTGADAFYLSCVKYYDDFLFKKSESEPCIKLAVGLNDENPYDPMIYPNLIGVNEELHIRNSSFKSVLELYDVIGKLVSKKTLTSQHISIVIDVTPGIYFFRLIDEKASCLKTGILIFE